MDMSLEEGQVIEIAEPEHIETLFDAVMDTTTGDVAGTESYGLTRAQTYAWGVLQANGVMSNAQRVAGAESFFSKVGDGARAIWEFIQKIFKNVWNFFFGKGENTAKSITDETEELLARNRASLQAWVANDAKLREHFKHQSDVIDKALSDIQQSAASSSDQRTASELKEKLHAAKALPAPEAVKVVKEVMERYVKINSRTQKGLDEVCDKAIEEYKKYQTLVTFDHSSKFVGTVFAELYKDYHSAMTHNASKPIDVYVRVPQGMRTLADAARAQESLSKVVKDLESEMSSISVGVKTDMISQIKKLEEKVNRPEMKDEHREKFRKDLTTCKLFLSLTTQAIKQLRSTCDNIKRISNMINRLFGVATV